MATAKEIKKHLEIALKEIGKIEPWFDKDFDSCIFSHRSYPDVEYAGESKDEVIKNYPLYLRDFIEERLNDNLAPHIEKAAKGRGGKRKGSGRPKGTKKEKKKRVYLPTDIADWYRNHQSVVESSIRQMIAKGRN
jgi:hypothetical protein